MRLHLTTNDRTKIINALVRNEVENLIQWAIQGEVAELEAYVRQGAGFDELDGDTLVSLYENATGQEYEH